MTYNKQSNHAEKMIKQLEIINKRHSELSTIYEKMSKILAYNHAGRDFPFKIMSQIKLYFLKIQAKYVKQQIAKGEQILVKIETERLEATRNETQSGQKNAGRTEN